jgi:hypothetical protein
VDEFPYTDTHKIAKQILKDMKLEPDRDMHCNRGSR